MPPLVVKCLWCVYALIFATIAYLAFRDDLSLHYPQYFVVPAVLANCCVLLGILTWGIGARPMWMRRVWRGLFPVLVAIPVVGIAMDAVLPQDYNLRLSGIAWIANTTLNVLLVMPGYIANWRIGYASS